MKLNYFAKQMSTVARWMATTLFCLFAIAFVWQGAFFSNMAAIAAPADMLIASSDAGSQAQNKAAKDARETKGFVRDAADKVEQTAKSNAKRVENATDGDGSFVERKAKKDAARIEKRAEEDAARTQGAIDNTKNAVESAIDNIKGAFSN
ncbi:hypothetical protein [Myxacorys almedinensis]|uniref:Uncharacterized protein n=1 Tax=Myxacorys almedinensis A TaxID=2690445 RepID=A0A8J7Z1B6_9CYAN|nr:hypothetical protein [Myxacorys almedinensis]NDJ15956.1 hypothetical protein [Myxacorys almedinensis A]